MMTARSSSPEPIYDLQPFAELLGWRGLRREQMSEPMCETIVWYWTTDRKLFLQINPSPQGQADEYEATVYAERYGFPLQAVGFHPFSLVNETVDDAAHRLRPLLSRSHFRNRQWRKTFLVSLAEGKCASF